MKKLLTILICFLSVQLAFAQSSQDRARMEKERQEIQQELQQIQSEYNKVKGQTKATLGQLNIIQRKMDVQDRYIGNINKEIRTINDDIYLSNLEINHLKIQLDTLKAQYARSVVYAYKNKSSYDFLNFIFSANSFNDAVKRMAYLRSYRSYRQQQVNSIIETQKMIEDRKLRLLGMQTQKKSALQNQQEQLNALEDQKREKDAVAAKLRSQAKDLSKQMTAKKKRDAQLKNQILAVIRRDMERAKKEEADRLAAERAKAKANAPANENATTTTTTKTKTSKPTSYLDLNAKDVALNASFEKNRGRLPWPVDNGNVTIPFGRSKVDNLTVDNPGITIGTPSPGVPVKAIFEGEVRSVSNIGDGMMVTIRHGKYFSVYSGLSSVSVSKGDMVTTGQVIGRAGKADDNDGGQIDLILMEEFKNVNPQPWLRR
jgi:septal ring factor EnvC (AmiA/AmiB activator)